MKGVAYFSIGLLALACGGSTDSGGSAGKGGNGGSGGSGATGGSGGSGATGGSGGTSPVGCPATEPSGGACTTPDLRCTYGDSVRPECRHDWICNQGTWVTTKSFCPPPPTGECTSTPPAEGTVCNTEAAVCDYPDGTICLCNSCSAGPCAAPPPKWQCAPAPTGPGCPAIVPNDGTACTTPGAQCTYGNPCGPSGAIVKCTNGAWQWEKDIACGA